MKDIVFVSGHKNPDSDSICSAIAYAHLLFVTGRYNAVPVRLGDVNKETEFILKRFGVEIPVLLKTVKQKVEDLDYDKAVSYTHLSNILARRYLKWLIETIHKS